MAKSKRNEKLFNEMAFTNAQEAKAVKESCEAKLAKSKTAMIVAAIASGLVLMALIFSETNSTVSFLFGFAGVCSAIVSYILGGGLDLAISLAFKITKIGWFLIPVFPMDLMVGIMTFFVAALIFLCVPIIFVAINKKQIKADYDAAASYLNCSYAM